MPLLILYLGIIRRFELKISYVLYWFLVCLQLFACTLTFARAPFLTLLIVLIIPNILLGTKLRRIFFLLTLGILIVLTAGIVTNLQYNITEFTFLDTLNMGWNFFYNRMLFVPNVVPIHDAFSIITSQFDPLYLKYSRLRSLFTGSAIGTDTSLSIFVSPVGYIGDVYRNFHYFGLVLFGIFTGTLFYWLDEKFQLLGAIQIVFLFFSLLALIFYWIMGVVFSMGAVFSLVLVLFLSHRYQQFGVNRD